MVGNHHQQCAAQLHHSYTYMTIVLAFYQRDANAMLARVIVIATCLSVCLSVCPSLRHAPVLCQNVMISSPSGDAKFHHQILRGSPRTGASKKGRSEKFSDFLALSVNISKTVEDTAKVTISDSRKSYMGFRLTPRSMTLDDLELL